MAELRGIPNPGEYDYGPTGSGATGGGWGGTADPWNPHGAPNMSGFFVSGGGGFNQGFVSGGPQTNPAAAHYYSGYWAGVEVAQYGFGGHPYGNLNPWPFGGQGDDPSIFRFLRPAPDTREAFLGIERIFAAISGAIVGPAEASPRDFPRIPASLLPVGEGGAPGGGSPIPQDIFATDSNSAGAGRGEPVTSADLAAELVSANTRLARGAERRWQANLLIEIAFDPNGFFPYGRLFENLRGAERFFDINREGGYPPSDLALFPVYRRLFGEGTPLFYIGRQELSFSNDPLYGIERFKFGPILPPEY